MRSKNILIVDVEIDIARNIKAILDDENYITSTAGNSDEALNCLANEDYDLIILDVWLDNSKLDGIDLLKNIRETNNIPVMLFQVTVILIWRTSYKEGANEFIEKPFTSEKTLLSVSRSIELQNQTENINLQNKDYEFIGNSIALNKIRSIITKVAPTSSRVMIYGDSGTGKDLVAREIHRNSNFKDGPFIAINAALMEPENIENEFFGSTKNNLKTVGYFEAAANGTIFIDEVGEMPLQTQAKILRVLTDKQFTKVGDNKTIELKCRIICSSIKNLEKLSEEGSFRKDLFHRLHVVTIKLPKSG